MRIPAISGIGGQVLEGSCDFISILMADCECVVSIFVADVESVTSMLVAEFKGTSSIIVTADEGIKLSKFFYFLEIAPREKLCLGEVGYSIVINHLRVHFVIGYDELEVLQPWPVSI